MKTRRRLSPWCPELLLSLGIACAPAAPRALRTVTAEPRAEASLTEPAPTSAAPHIEKWWLTPSRTVFNDGSALRVGAPAGYLVALNGHYKTFLFRELDKSPVQVDTLLPAGQGWRTSGQPFAAGWLFATRPGSVLGAFDDHTLAPAWQLGMMPGHRMLAVSRTEHVALISTSNGENEQSKLQGELLGVDASTGKVLWRSPDTSRVAGKAVAADGKFWVLSSQQRKTRLELLEPATGKVTWSTGVDYVRELLPSGRHIVLMRGSHPLTVETREARTGMLVAQATLPGQARHASVISGGVLFALTFQLSALRVDTLQLLWQKPLHWDPSRNGGHLDSGPPPLIAADGAVVFCENSTLRAFEQKTGEQLWSYGLEQRPCPSLAVLPGPRLFIPRTPDFRNQEQGDNSLIELVASSVPPETLTVRGHVSGFEGYFSSSLLTTISPAGADVLVDNQLVKVADDGSYEARVTTRGTLRVDVDVPLPDDSENEKCDPGAQGHAEVPLTGAGQYTADLELERNCW